MFRNWERLVYLVLIEMSRHFSLFSSKGSKMNDKYCSIYSLIVISSLCWFENGPQYLNMSIISKKTKRSQFRNKCHLLRKIAHISLVWRVLIWHTQIEKQFALITNTCSYIPCLIDMQEQQSQKHIMRYVLHLKNNRGESR